MEVSKSGAVMAESPGTVAGVASDPAGMQANDPKATDPKFGEVWKQIQAKYGAKEEKPREIKKTLGKDDFLKIMVTQMKFQDPTQPFKAERMAADMAQFASIEQMQNMNTQLTKLASQNQPAERMAMINLIGKTVTVDRDRFPHLDGEKHSIPFTLPEPAEVKVIISAENGEPVLEKELGKLNKGENSIEWDGKKLNNQPAKAGQYMMRITAVNPDTQKTLDLGSQSKAKILGVNFEGTEPAFMIAAGKSYQKINFKNITKIEDGGMTPMAAAPMGATSMGSPMQGRPEAKGTPFFNGNWPGGTENSAETAPVSPAPEAEKSPAFFTFKKGEGSKPLDTEKLNPEVAQVLSRYHAEAANAAALPKDNEKGFPSGLTDNMDGKKIEKGGE